MKAENIDISFIIPVYNGASVISEMIASVFRMPLDISFEVIVIDDGSTDETPAVLQKLQAAHEGLQIIRSGSSGQSRARNIGLQAAKGTYVFFADADDRLIPEGAAKLFQAAEEGAFDIVCGTYRRREPGRQPYLACLGFPDGVVSRDPDGAALFARLKTESAFGYLWNKLFRRQFLLEKEIVFDDTIKVFMEDQLFILKAFGCGAKFFFLNEPVYEYFFAGVSTTRQADPDIAEKSVAMLKSYDAFLQRKGMREDNRDLFVPLALRMACWAAFKNIAYEGAVYAKIKQRLTLFSEEASLQAVFGDPGSKQYICEIPSFLQRALFGLTRFLLGKKKEGLLAAVFVIGSPVFQLAAKAMVR